jgi:sugar transferase EpsL
MRNSITKPSKTSRLWTRPADIALSAIGLAVALPLMAAASVMIVCSMGLPVLFRDTRVGKGGVPFTLYKLRTMTNDHDSRGKLLPDEMRLTMVGKLIRNTSIDELPQLWNVLRGDMRLVGPRPLVERYLARYSPEQRRRLEVRPGITGWAQIHGRNAIAWEKKFELDVWYVDNRSLSLDLQILAKTLVKVFDRRDINHAPLTTMPEFWGSPAGSGHHSLSAERNGSVNSPGGSIRVSGTWDADT